VLTGPRRAITREEHIQIVEREKNPETKAFYELCWHLGGSQSDVANLEAENIDWKNRVIGYARKKTKSMAFIHFGTELEQILRLLPSSGLLFPRLSQIQEKHRAKEFRRRCNGLNIYGVSLHSYRYAWAERARKCPVNKYRHCRRILASGILARPKHVKVTQAGRLEPALLGEHLAGEFPFQLGPCVRALRFGLHCFNFGHYGIVAINRGGTTQHQFLYASLRCLFQHARQAFPWCLFHRTQKAWPWIPAR
jgi:hypothetical protein